MFFIKNTFFTALTLCTLLLTKAEKTIVNTTSSTLAIQINYSNSNAMVPCSFKSMIIDPFKNAIIPDHPIDDCQLFSFFINIEKGPLNGQSLRISLDEIDKNKDFVLSIENNNNTLVANITQNGSKKIFQP